MNKQFEYRGYKFNIKVELRHTVERRPNGAVLHMITVNDMGPGNYHKTAITDDTKLIDTILGMELDARHWIDRREDGNKDPIIQKLEELGFK